MCISCDPFLRDQIVKFSLLKYLDNLVVNIYKIILGINLKIIKRNKYTKINCLLLIHPFIIELL